MKILQFSTASLAAFRAATALIAGTVGGYAFYLLHLPLPWTLGALTGAATLSLLVPQFTLPAIMRDAARPIIGVMAGSAFTPVVVSSMANWWQALPLLLGALVAYTFAGQAFFRRICGYDQATAVLCSMPGGLGEMSLLGTQLDADVRRLVLVHSARIVLVVSIVPFIIQLMTGSNLTRTTIPHASDELASLDWFILAVCAVAGYAVGKTWFRSLGGIMIAPLLLSAICHGTGLTTAAPPVWLVAAMQVVIGCITGARFVGISLAQARDATLHGAVWTLVLLATSATLAVLAAQLWNIPTAALFLALAPGGFAEMTIISFAIGIEVAFVVTCHVVRVFYAIVAAPILLRFATRWLT